MAITQMFAQQPIVQQVNKYAETEGLSSYNVRTISQDKKGFIWVGTQNGLNRFDGIHFDQYTLNSESKYRICGVDVRALVQDEKENLLWMLANEGGLNAIDLNTATVVRTVPLPHVGADEWGMSMIQRKNELWLGLSTGLRIYNTCTGRFLPAPPLPANGLTAHNFETTALLTDTQDRVWAFYSSYGIVVYDGHTKAIIRKIPLEQFDSKQNFRGNIRFNSCFLLDASRILMGTSQGLCMATFTSENVIRVSRLAQLPTDLAYGPLESVNRNRSGNIMVAGHNKLYELNADFTEASALQEPDDDPDGNWLSAVQSIYIDRQNNYWLGCQQGLALIKGNKKPFRSYYRDKASGLKLGHVRSICPVNGEEILTGLRNGIARVQNNDGSFLIQDSDHLYHHILKDPQGRILVSTPEGLTIYTGAKFLPIAAVYSEFRQFDKVVINSHVYIGDSTLVMGSEDERGILYWNYKRHTITTLNAYSSATPLAANTVNNIFKDSKDKLWVLSDHVITILQPDGSAPRYLRLKEPVNGRELNLFFDATEAMGRYWVASYGNGIIELDDSFRVAQILNTQQGLSNNGVYQIFNYHNQLIITTDNGLSVWNRGRFKNYFREDGLHSNSFEEVAGLMQDGLIYAGGVKGFTIINPALFSVNEVPPAIYLTRITVNRDKQRADIDTANTGMCSLSIPSDALQTTLYFSGINYSNSERTRYAYRIREHNEEWIDIGTQQYINLIGLSPGKYHVEIKAANEDGVWSRPAAIQLVYLPKWYQTWWFKGFIAMMCIGMAYGFYRMRISQILKQQKIRKDVASDLHDDIGSSLNSVKVFAHLAKADPAQQDYIENVEQHLEHATIGLRDMIWVLDDKLDTVEDLSTRLLLHATRPAEALGINVQFRLRGTTKHIKLTKPVKRNLFLIAKEAINNSVKYAECTTIILSVSLNSHKKLLMMICDNGRGFDVAAASNGYGLNNLKIRAEQIKFDCSLSSGNEGTRITLTER